MADRSLDRTHSFGDECIPPHPDPSAPLPAADARKLIAYDWLTTATGNNLHGPSLDLTDAEADSIVNDGGARIRLGCGRTAWAITPGMFTRGGLGEGLPRCSRCCEVHGLPMGSGSPKNDALARVVLGLPADGGPA